MDTPASLLERLKRPGDQSAWARFVELYTPLLCCWARRAGLQQADMADLVQEVLGLLVQKLPEFTYDPRRSFQAWLHTVTVNKLRECRRRRTPVTGAADVNLSEIPAADELGAIEEAEYRRHLVSQGLQALRSSDEFSANEWKAFQDHVIAGRDADEVAAELGARVGTVYAAKSRVLTRLRQELKGLLD